MAQGLRPCEDQFGEPHPPLDFARRLGDRRLAGGTKLRVIEEETRLGLLERAKRQNARQHHRGTADRAGEFFGERAGRAARRHIDRGIRHFERREIFRKALDNAAFEQRAREGFQKRRAGRDGKDVRRLHETSGMSSAHGLMSELLDRIMRQNNRKK